MRKFRAFTLATAALMILGLGSANVAQADQIFSTPTGATDSTGGSVSATVDFSLSGNTLTVTLTNTQAGVANAGQLLTDVFFSLSSAGSPTLSSQTGDLITLSSNGTVTNLGTSALGWGFGAATVGGTSGFELCVICQGGVAAGATPSEGILGPSPNGNPSIDGNGPHNPFVNQTATFTLTGIPTGATADDVVFSFGTTPGNNVSAPEPGALTLLASALIGFGLFLSMKRLFA
jgi:hypothetical protein